jgi:hypothetical protein
MLWVLIFLSVVHCEIPTYNAHVVLNATNLDVCLDTVRYEKLLCWCVSDSAVATHAKPFIPPTYCETVSIESKTCPDSRCKCGGFNHEQTQTKMFIRVFAYIETVNCSREIPDVFLAVTIKLDVYDNTGAVVFGCIEGFLGICAVACIIRRRMSNVPENPKKLSYEILPANPKT